MKQLHCIVTSSPKRIIEGKFAEKESYLVGVCYGDKTSEHLVIVPELYDADNGMKFPMGRIKQGSAFTVTVKRIKLKDGSKYSLAWEIELAA